MVFTVTIYFAMGLGSILDGWELRDTCVCLEAHMTKPNYTETARCQINTHLPIAQIASNTSSHVIVLYPDYTSRRRTSS